MWQNVAYEPSNLARVNQHARDPSLARTLARGLGNAARWAGRLARGQVVKRVGGPARARVVVLFGAVLALNGADMATIGRSRLSWRARCTSATPRSGC